MQIKNKVTWFKIFNSKIFNRTEILSIEEFIKNYSNNEIIYSDKLWILRNTKFQGAPFVEGNTWETISRCMGGMFPSDQYIVTEKAPDEAILVQGEFDGFNARISFLHKPMRYALLEEQHHITRMQLIGLIGYENYSKLRELLDIWPDHIIEFSLFDKGVGIFNEPLIIWEIRSY